MKTIAIPEFHTQAPSPAQLGQWQAAIEKDGYLIIRDALPKATCDHFAARIKDLPAHPNYGARSLVRLFELGMDFVHLLENQPLLALAERLFGTDTHIIALQGHRMVKGDEILSFHSDEIYYPRPETAGDDAPYPPIIAVINCHYYLQDTPIELGPTHVVPGSHLAGRQPRPGTPSAPGDGTPPTWRGRGAVAAVCKAGDCVIYNNQTWHSGGKITSDATRLAVVPSYARRWVAQRFWPFLNYNLSREVLDRCTPRQRELLGEHGRAAYG